LKAEEVTKTEAAKAPEDPVQKELEAKKREVIDVTVCVLQRTVAFACRGADISYRINTNDK
jgi:hypothetical protein